MRVQGGERQETRALAAQALAAQDARCPRRLLQQASAAVWATAATEVHHRCESLIQGRLGAANSFR